MSMRTPPASMCVSLKRTFTSNLKFERFGTKNSLPRSSSLFMSMFIVFSSSAVFIALKFTCQGQHLKKLVSRLGASRIIKAGLSI